MSFMLTTEQFKNRTKLVTRRLGWKNLKPGDLVMGCEKCQGIPKGGKVNQLHPISIVSNRSEPLSLMTSDYSYGKTECIDEGFPDLEPSEFVEMFCRHNGCSPHTIVQRIRFIHWTK
jgi:hypothetical protein